MIGDKLQAVLNTAQNWYTSHSAVVKGLLSLAIGIICIAHSYGMVIHFMLFAAGLFFLYFGLALLKVTPLTDLVDNMRCCKK